MNSRLDLDRLTTNRRKFGKQDIAKAEYRSPDMGRYICTLLNEKNLTEDVWGFSGYSTYLSGNQTKTADK